MDHWLGQPTGPAFYVDDFDETLSEGLAARERTPGKWHLQRSRWGARKGELLVAEAAAQAPLLRFTPGRTGAHAIFVGAYSPGGPGGLAAGAHGVYIRLNGEPHFTFLQVERAEPSYQEMFCKTEDLTGRTIEIGNFDRPSALDYIKLVPVEPRPFPPATGKLIGILDFADDADTSEPPMFEAGSAVRRHADAGYDTILWKAYAVRCEYHTRIGEVRSYTYSDQEIAARPAGDPIDPTRGLKGVGGLLQKYDTMRQAVDEAHRAGIRIYGWARINNEFSKPNHQFSATTPFHVAHPEMRQRYRDGTLSPRLSFAYYEVRKHKCEILCEIASYGMDGICIDVLRHPAMASYDLPLVEEYLKRTGRDPRQMENDGDEEWLRFRCGAFTQFLREVREGLDRQAGRRFPIMIRTVDQPWRNLHIGCDVEAWLAEGLVDEIIFGPHCATAENYPDSMNLRPYLEKASGRIRVYGQVWRYGSGIHAEVLAKDFYDQGVAGVAFYESNLSVCLPSIRDRLWRFSRPEHILR